MRFNALLLLLALSGTAQAPRRPSCTSVYPARPRLLRLHVPRLARCVPGGNSLVFGGPSRRKEIALTFVH